MVQDQLLSTEVIMGFTSMSEADIRCEIGWYTHHAGTIIRMIRKAEKSGIPGFGEDGRAYLSEIRRVRRAFWAKLRAVTKTK